MSTITKARGMLRKRPIIANYFFAIIVFITLVFLFRIFPPEGVDWIRCFYKVAQNPLHPYEVELFINPPWLAFLLFPFRYFSENTSLAINTTLNLMAIGLLVVVRRGSLYSLILSLTSFPVLSTIANGNIEWVLAIGFILRNEWGVPLLLLKPQVGILSILTWDSFKKNKILFVIPACSIIILSFIVWRNWLSDLMENIHNLQRLQNGMETWNSSLFPWSIPLGIFILYWIIKKSPADSEILGCIATLCIVPYFAIYSVGILYTLISVTHKRIAVVLWFLLWLYPFIHHVFRVVR